MNQQRGLDVLLVLGAGRYESGRRAEYAAEIAYSGDYPVIVSGGKVLFSRSQKTEAEIMGLILEKRGIESSRIYLERRATSTIENFEFSKNLLSLFRNVKKIGIVTGRAHMTRAKTIAVEKLSNYELLYFPVESRNWKDYSAEGLAYALEIAGRGLTFFSENNEGFCSFLRNLTR